MTVLLALQSTCNQTKSEAIYNGMNCRRILRFWGEKKEENGKEYTKMENLIVIKRPAGAIIGVVADNNGIIAGCPGKDTSIADVMLHVTDNGTFGNRSQGQNVADHKVGFLAAVNELARVHALGRHEKLLLVLVSERVAEGDSGERGASTRVVDDIGHHALEIPISLPEIKASETGRALAVVGVGLENGSRTLPLGSYDSSHGSLRPSTDALAAAKLW